MAIVRQGLLTEGWMTVDADDFAMQDSTAVAAITFPADDRPTTLGTAYFDYLALAFHVFPPFKSSGATDDLGGVRCAGRCSRAIMPELCQTQRQDAAGGFLANKYFVFK